MNVESIKKSIDLMEDIRVDDIGAIIATIVFIFIFSMISLFVFVGANTKSDLVVLVIVSSPLIIAVFSIYKDFFDRRKENISELIKSLFGFKDEYNFVSIQNVKVYIGMLKEYLEVDKKLQKIELKTKKEELEKDLEIHKKMCLNYKNLVKENYMKCDDFINDEGGECEFNNG